MAILRNMLDEKGNTFIDEKLFEKNQKIKGDFAIIMLFIFGLIKYLFLVYPRIIMLLYYAITQKKQKFNRQKKCLISDPIIGIKQVIDWFFEARVTASLILLLWGIFVIQILFFPEKLLYLLMTHPDHLEKGYLWTSVTSIFLHADLTHIISNSLALLVFGRLVERYIKGLQFFILFIGSGIIANLASNTIMHFLDQSAFSLGASGAIAGIIMFAIVIEPFSLTYLVTGFPIPAFLVGWALIISDITGLTNPSRVNHFAHLGGYASILLLYFFLDCKNQQRTKKGFIANIMMLTILIAIRQFYFV